MVITENKDNQLKIVIVSFDWNNIWENNPLEVFAKLKRDGFREQDKFFNISWSGKTYYKKLGQNLETYHMRAKFKHLRPLYDFILFFKLPFVFKKFSIKPDIVVVYDFPLIPSLLLVKILFRFKTILFVTNLPSDLISTRNTAWVRRIYQNIMEYVAKYFVDYVFCINETTKQYALNVGIAYQKIKLFISNTISRDMSIISTVSKGALRRRLQLADDKKIITSIGRLEPEKGMEDLISAFLDLNDERLVLCIAGDGILRGKIEKRIQESGYKENIFLLGQLNRHDIWELYKDTDIFILLPKSEALGLVFWEAMYMNIPVIGSPVGGIVESIGIHEERGFFWQKKDGVSKLKSIIEKILFTEEFMGQKDKKVNQAKVYVESKLHEINTINSML